MTPTRRPGQVQFGIGPQVPLFRMLADQKDPNVVYVTCTRCNGKFDIKDRKLWARSSALDTRPCPYCFKVSVIRKQKES